MITRQLYSSPVIGVAEFLHSPHDGTWLSMRRVTGDNPLVVFPRHQVEIQHEGEEAPILAGPNVAMLYNPGGMYSRHQASPEGDQYVEFQVGAAAAAALEQEVDAVRDGLLRGTHAPAEPGVYLQQHLLTRYLKEGEPDPLIVEDTALRIVRRVLSRVAGQRPRRDATRERHRELAEAAKRILSDTLGRRLALEELARMLGYSPFHLERVFRAETGFSLHEYRLQLRLRTGLERLPESAGSLAPLALELGFVSHSHFTTAFRREFGLPPSAVRERAQVRKILESARPFAA